jgi:hypothetical protein
LRSRSLLSARCRSCGRTAPNRCYGCVQLTQRSRVSLTDPINCAPMSSHSRGLSACLGVLVFARQHVPPSQDPMLGSGRGAGRGDAGRRGASILPRIDPAGWQVIHRPTAVGLLRADIRRTRRRRVGHDAPPDAVAPVLIEQACDVPPPVVMPGEYVTVRGSHRAAPAARRARPSNGRLATPSMRRASGVPPAAAYRWAHTAKFLDPLPNMAPALTRRSRTDDAGAPGAPRARSDVAT